MSEEYPDSRCAQSIYSLVNTQLSEAIKREIESASRLAAAMEGDRLWNADPDNGLGMHRSPYNISNAEANLKRDSESRSRWQKITNYAVATFIGVVK